jgi:hypothetical protein
VHSVGFTGTRKGMSPPQRRAARLLLKNLDPTHFHHGDCVGADAEMHAIVRAMLPECVIVLHPCSSDSNRAFCAGDYSSTPIDALARNREIVAASSVMLATPLEDEEMRSGGTWYTIRHARKTQTSLYVVSRRGEITQYDAI